MALKLKPNTIPETAWTERANKMCCICGAPCDIERDEIEHSDDCDGCPICEMPIRLFRELSNGVVLGVAMHPACFESILA